MTNEELLDIDALMARPDRASNHARQLRAHKLWQAARSERQQGNLELAERLKAAGNRLVSRNYEVNWGRGRLATQAEIAKPPAKTEAANSVNKFNN